MSPHDMSGGRSVAGATVVIESGTAVEERAFKT